LHAQQLTQGLLFSKIEASYPHMGIREQGHRFDPGSKDVFVGSN
jgi:hypothetical protein